MKLVLHIGTEKTGTTLLQNWLYQNRSALSAQGVFLSDVMSSPNNRKLPSYFQTEFDDYHARRNIHTEAQRDAYFAGFADEVRAEVTAAAQQHHTMVISSEQLHSQIITADQADALHALLAPSFDQITVLCYLREQSEMRKSLYSTRLRGQETTTIAQHDADADESWPYYNYHALATRWARAFGKETLALRIYDRAHFPQRDIRRDFLATVLPALDARALDFETTIANEKISFVQARALRALNKAHTQTEVPGANRTRYAMVRALLAAKSAGIGEILDADQPAFFDRFVESNHRLSQEFFDGAPLFQRPTPQDMSSLSEKAYSLDDIGEILEELSAALFAEVSPFVLTPRDSILLRRLASRRSRPSWVTRTQAIALLHLAGRAAPTHKGIKSDLARLLSKVRKPRKP